MLVCLKATAPASAEDEDVVTDDIEAPPADEPASEDKSGGRFDQIMEMNAPAQAAKMPMPMPLQPSQSGMATVPLAEFTRVADALAKIRERDGQTQAPPVVLGAAEYKGQAKEGALQLSAKMQVTLGRPGQWKVVPLVGENVVVVSAKDAKGAPLPLSR
jgi:hypothetical protein